MTFALIVIALLIIGVAVVAWAVRKKPVETRTGPREGDTAWNDPVSAADTGAVTPPRTDELTRDQPASTEPRP